MANYVRVYVSVATGGRTSAAAAAASMDTALTNAMNAIIASPPPGYQEGSLRIEGQPKNIATGGSTNNFFTQQFSYTLLI